jgi:hypothetical protein
MNESLLIQLRDEIVLPAYVGMTDQEIADAVNAKTVETRRLVPCWEVKKHAIENGYWATVKMSAENTTIPVEARGLAISARDWIEDVTGEIKHMDMDLPSAQYMIASLVTATMISQANADDLDTLADKTIRWVDHIGIGTVGIGYVQKAKELIEIPE